MSEESTVLLVDAQHLPGALEAQLQSREVFAEHASASDIAQVAPVLFPDLVVIPGKADVAAILEALGAMRPPLAAVVVADRAMIRTLRDQAAPAAALIPQDLPAAAIAHRIATMAKKSAQGEPLVRPQSLKPKLSTARGSLAPEPSAPAQDVRIIDAAPAAGSQTAKSDSTTSAKKPALGTARKPSLGSLAKSTVAAAPAASAGSTQAAAEEQRRAAEEQRRVEAETKRKEADEQRKKEWAEKQAAADKKREELAKKKEESERKRAELAEKKKAEMEARAEERRRAAEVRRSVPPRASSPPRAGSTGSNSVAPKADTSSLFSVQALEISPAAKSVEPQAAAGKAPAAERSAKIPSARPGATTRSLNVEAKREERTAAGAGAAINTAEHSVVMDLPVEMRLSLTEAKTQLPSLRLAYLDTDLTRADSITAALRRKGLEVFPLTPDIQQTRWPLLRRFAPQALIVDEKGMVRRDAEWVETFRGDPFLRHVPLVVLRLSRLFNNADGSVDLEPLLQLIEPMGREELALLDKLRPGRQVDLKISQINPSRLVQMLTEQDRNTRLDCHGGGERLVWPLGPGYAGKAKLLEEGSEEVRAKLSPEEALTWLLNHDDCEIAVHEHSEPLAHASESKDATKLLLDMTEALGVPSRHQSVFPAAINENHPMASLLEPLRITEPPRSTEPPRVTEPGLGPAGPALTDTAESDSQLEILDVEEASPERVPATRDAALAVEPPAAPQRPAIPNRSPTAVTPHDHSAPTPMDSVKALTPKTASQEWKEKASAAAQKVLSHTTAAQARYQQLFEPLRSKLPPKLYPYVPWVPVAVLFLIVLLIVWPSSEEAAPQIAEQQAANAKPDATAAPPAPKAAQANQPEATPKPEPEAPEVHKLNLWMVAPDTNQSSCEELLGPAAPKSESPARAAGYWKQARNLLMVGKTSEAVEMMCLAGLYDPAGPATEGLTEYYLGKRSLKEAERWVRTSLKADPERRRSQELLGDVENQKGNLEESRKLWLETMLLKGDETAKLGAIARKLLEDGKRAIKGGDLPRAERELRRAATLDPQNLQVAATLARVLMARNMGQAAADWATHTRELDPNDSSALLLSGEIAEEQKKFDEARGFYQSVPPGDPFHSQAQSRLQRLP